jgi:hypothetical protein
MILLAADAITVALFSAAGWLLEDGAEKHGIDRLITARGFALAGLIYVIFRRVW